MLKVIFGPDGCAVTKISHSDTSVLLVYSWICL